MNVVWTHTAIGHLTDIYEYVARDSARYATRMVDRITSRSKQIGRFPESGQIVPEYNDPDIREVIEGAYHLIYHTEREFFFSGQTCPPLCHPPVPGQPAY